MFGAFLDRPFMNFYLNTFPFLCPLFFVINPSGKRIHTFEKGLNTIQQKTAGVCLEMGSVHQKDCKGIQGSLFL